jgi:hypothetical protein
MEESTRTAFLERLSLLSFAAVAGCAGGAQFPQVAAKGSDGAALPPIGTRHVDSSTGVTTYTLGSGYTLAITPGTSDSLSATLALNGATVNTMSATYANELLTLVDGNSGTTVVSGSNNAPATVAGAALTYTSDGGSATGNGQTASVATTITQGTEDATIASTGSYAGNTYSGKSTVADGGSGVSGCHACPLVGVAESGRAHPDGHLDPEMGRGDFRARLPCLRSVSVPERRSNR